MLDPPLTDEGHWTTRTPAEWEGVRSEDLVSAFRVDGGSCPEVVRRKVLRVLFERARPVVGHRVEPRFFEDALQLVCLKLWLELHEGPGGNDAPGGFHVKFKSSLACDAIDAARKLKRAEQRSPPSGDGVFHDPRGPQAVPVQEMVSAILDVTRSRIDDLIDQEIFDGLREGATLKTLAAGTRLSLREVKRRRDALFGGFRKVALLRRMFAEFEVQVQARWASPQAVAAGQPEVSPEDEVTDGDLSVVSEDPVEGGSVNLGKPVDEDEPVDAGEAGAEAGGRHEAGMRDGRRKREEEP